jgi:hypothetical protein
MCRLEALNKARQARIASGGGPAVPLNPSYDYSGGGTSGTQTSNISNIYYEHLSKISVGNVHHMQMMATFQTQEATIEELTASRQRLQQEVIITPL